MNGTTTGMIKKGNAEVTGNVQVDQVSISSLPSTDLQSTSVQSVISQENLLILLQALQKLQSTPVQPVVSQPNQTGMQQTSGFASLPVEDKHRYRDILMNLNRNACLFIMDKDTCSLRRCAPAEVKQAFDKGEVAYLVTRPGSEESSSSSCQGYFLPVTKSF